MNEVLSTIGKTPLLKLEKLSAETGLDVFIKYEAKNPGGSIKDRAALNMIESAEEKGLITPGKSILVEPTSGNTGIAIAMIAAVKGYKAVLVMPESMSEERRKLLLMYGAVLELTPASRGMEGAVARAQEILDFDKNAWMVGQFSNPDNPRAHELYTAPEIEEGLGGSPDFIVAGVGTGGTISGVAHYFKSKGATTQIVAVEPKESPLISQAYAGELLQPSSHGIQGIGANFIPDNLDLNCINQVIGVATDDAIKQARWLAKEEALMAGISTGANIAAVRALAELIRQEDKPQTLVTFAVDTGERYISTGLFAYAS